MCGISGYGANLSRISDLETKIGAGLIEEVIQVAEGELKLVDVMVQSKPYVLLYATLTLLTSLVDGKTLRRSQSKDNGHTLCETQERLLRNRLLKSKTLGIEIDGVHYQRFVNRLYKVLGQGKPVA